MLKKVTTGSSPQQMWERLLHNEPLFILDVRNRDEFERWRVEGPHPVPTFNIPYFELLDLEGEEEDVTEAVMHGVRAQLMEQLPPLPEFPEAYVEIKRANAGLASPDARKTQELELGKNICAVGKATGGER